MANALLQRGRIVTGSEVLGRVFEYFILQELLAHSHYSGQDYPVTHWRTTSQIEVDFILGDHEIALEVKGVEQVARHHLRGLKAFGEEYTTRQAIVVSLDAKPRQVGDILILPWDIFLKRLWSQEIFKK